MKKTIGILGGMGPLATADLFTKIVEMTKAATDQEHIRIFIDNNPAIPDRTDALLYGGKDPMPEMEAALRNLESAGAECILLPCNTAHCYLPSLQAMTEIPFLNMPVITAEQCARRYPGKTACILATRGTLATGLYHSVLEDHQVPFLVPGDNEQDVLMYLIYDVVKASKPVLPEKEAWQTLLDTLRLKGADYFILACTELPVLATTLDVPGPFVDPTAELARAAIQFCGYTVKEKPGEE